MNQTFFIMGNGLMRVMNEKAAIVSREFQVIGTSFEFIKYNIF